MKVYLIKEGEIDALLALIDRDPKHGFGGGSSRVLSDVEQRAHDEAHRFFNFQVRNWIAEIKK